MDGGLVLLYVYQGNRYARVFFGKYWKERMTDFIKTNSAPLQPDSHYQIHETKEVPLVNGYTLHLGKK